MNQKIFTFVAAFAVFAVVFFAVDYFLQAYQGLALFPKGE